MKDVTLNSGEVMTDADFVEERGGVQLGGERSCRPMSSISFQKKAEALVHEYYSVKTGDERIDIVMNNLDLLSLFGWLEEIFLHAWSHGKGANCPQYAFLLLFVMNPERLLAASDPLPPGDVFTVYRGVAGKGDDRRIRGYSWSGSLEIALEFAVMRGMYGSLPDPSVYKSTISRKDVFAYIDTVFVYDRYVREKEFIVRPGGLSEPVEILCPTKESIGVEGPRSSFTRERTNLRAVSA
jgi:hypothetical protein